MSDIKVYDMNENAYQDAPGVHGFFELMSGIQPVLGGLEKAIGEYVPIICFETPTLHRHVTLSNTLITR